MSNINIHPITSNIQNTHCDIKKYITVLKIVLDLFFNDAAINNIMVN
jgi:hypothetical protein